MPAALRPFKSLEKRKSFASAMEGGRGISAKVWSAAALLMLAALPHVDGEFLALSIFWFSSAAFLFPPMFLLGYSKVECVSLV